LPYCRRKFRWKSEITDSGTLGAVVMEKALKGQLTASATELKQRVYTATSGDEKSGLISMCSGDSMGMVMLLERLSFSPISTIYSKIYPRNIIYVPVVNILACLDLGRKIYNEGDRPFYNAIKAYLSALLSKVQHTLYAVLYLSLLCFLFLKKHQRI
jgi:hypothetical protein